MTSLRMGNVAYRGLRKYHIVRRKIADPNLLVDNSVPVLLAVVSHLDSQAVQPVDEKRRVQRRSARIGSTPLMDTDWLGVLLLRTRNMGSEPPSVSGTM